MANTITVNRSTRILKVGFMAVHHRIVNRLVRPEERTEQQYIALAKRLASGWDSQQGVIALFGPDSPLWKMDKQYQLALDECFETRKKKFEDLKADPKKKAELETWSLGYVENGQVIKPVVLATTCNGRLTCIDRAMEYRREGYEEAAPRPITEETWTFPVEYFVFKDELERVRVQCGENSKGLAFVEPSKLSKLRACKILVSAGDGLNDIKNTLGTGMQPGYYWCKVDELWSKNNEFNRFPHEGKVKRPDLKIIERFLLDLGDEKRLPAALLNMSTEASELYFRSSPSSMKKENEKRERANASKKAGKSTGDLQTILTPITVDGVEAYLKELIEGKPKGPKAFTTKDWTNFKGNDSIIVQGMANAAVTGNTEMMKPFLANPQFWNLCYEIQDKGKIVEAMLLLNAVEDNRVIKFAEACLSGKDVKWEEIKMKKIS
jgi:hypothetical protein